MRFSTISVLLLLLVISVGPARGQFNIFQPFIQVANSFAHRIQGFFGGNGIEDVDGALPIMRPTTEKQPVLIEAEPLHPNKHNGDSAVDLLVIDNTLLTGHRIEDYETYAHYGGTNKWSKSTSSWANVHWIE